MILNCYTITATLDRELDENEIDAAVKDLFPFKRQTYLREVWRDGYENYAFNIINKLTFSRETKRFSGKIVVYFETVERGAELVDDIIAIIKLHEMTVSEVTRKWRDE